MGDLFMVDICRNNRPHLFYEVRSSDGLDVFYECGVCMYRVDVHPGLICAESGDSRHEYIFKDSRWVCEACGMGVDYDEEKCGLCSVCKDSIHEWRKSKPTATGAVHAHECVACGCVRPKSPQRDTDTGGFHEQLTGPNGELIDGVRFSICFSPSSLMHCADCTPSTHEWSDWGEWSVVVGGGDGFAYRRAICEKCGAFVNEFKKPSG